MKTKIWGYTRSFTERYIGCMPKGEFIRQVVEKDGVSRNWVAQRTEETHNQKEITLALSAPGQIILIQD